MSTHAFLLIDGEWTGTGPEDPDVGLCFDPATGQRAGSFSSALPQDVSACITAARVAFDTSAWAHSPRLRAEILLEFAARLTKQRPEIEEWLVRVNGKLPREAMFEVISAISKLTYYAGLARNIFGRITETEPGAFSNLAREPVGVVGIIVPWNAPVTLLISSLAPALAAGCTVVIKSAPQTARATTLTLECLSAITSLPKGVVNVFTELGSTGSEILVKSPDVDMISFTGSSAIGKQIMAAAAGTLKHLALELGGKSPSLIFPDANLSTALVTITAASTVMAGQMCTAASRVLVHESIVKQVQESLTGSLGRVRVGPGNDPTSQMGPLIDRANRDRVAATVEHAADHGVMHLHGKPLNDFPAGAFLTPSLVEIRDVNSSLIQQEIFGPVLILETFADEQEAISRANATRYGLSASVWTADRDRAERVSRQLQSGMVWINSYNRLLAEAESGGYHESGIGRLNGLEGLDAFMQTKHIYYELPADKQPR